MTEWAETNEQAEPAEPPPEVEGLADAPEQTEPPRDGGEAPPPVKESATPEAEPIEPPEAEPIEPPEAEPIEPPEAEPIEPPEAEPIEPPEAEPIEPPEAEPIEPAAAEPIKPAGVDAKTTEGAAESPVPAPGDREQPPERGAPPEAPTQSTDGAAETEQAPPDERQADQFTDSSANPVEQADSRSTVQPPDGGESPEKDARASEVEEVPEPKLPSPEWESDDGTVEHPGAEYRELHGPTFDGPPKPDDVRQGYLGDCYALAPMAAVAERRPDIVQDRVTEAEDGRVEVRLSHPDTGRDQTVAVERTAPHATTGNGRELHCHAGTDDGPGWVAAQEKALAAMEPDGYARLDQGGNDREMARTLERLTGYETDTKPTADLTDQEILETVRDADLERRPMVIGVDGAGASGTADPDAYEDLLADRELIADHAYSVEGLTDDGRILLRNPWGAEDNPDPLTSAELRQVSPMLITMSDRPLRKRM